MQYQESVTIQRCKNRAGDTYGRIELQHMADPKSVIVSLCGQRLYPKEFNIFGWPIFTQEVCDLFEWKENSLERIHGKDYRLTALVTYDSANVQVDPHTVNSLDGITSGIKDLNSLNKLLKDRVIYNKLLGGGKLNKYVIFGRYGLDEFGQVWTLGEQYEIPGMPIACTQSEFNKAYNKVKPDEFVSWGCGCAIPSEDDSCPWCTKKFTIEDVRKGRFDTINGKVAHSECAKQYEHEREIDKIIHRIMEFIYEDGLTFELLPNGYCNQPCCAHKPWFLCHTPDGDIKIGWRKRVISIEWKENFKDFDMSIFDSENVTKWKRGIHAWGTYKAYEYIKKVKEFVNPKPEEKKS